MVILAKENVTEAGENGIREVRETEM